MIKLCVLCSIMHSEMHLFILQAIANKTVFTHYSIQVKEKTYKSTLLIHLKYKKLYVFEQIYLIFKVVFLNEYQ